MKRMNVLGVVWLALCVSTVAYSEETWLSYRIPAQAESEVGYVGGDYKELTDFKPVGGLGLPKLVAADPRFGEVLGGRDVIVDKSRPDAVNWDVLWVDVNGNKRFEPGDRFELKSEDGRWWRAVVPVEFKGEDGPRLQHLQFGIYQGERYVAGPDGKAVPAPRRPEDKVSLYLQSAGYYFGKVKFGEKEHLLALVDANANGWFDDPPGPARVGDQILVDSDDSGKLGADYQHLEKLASVGKYIYVDGVYWGLSVAPDGSTITITRPQITMGRLHLEEAAAEITLSGTSGLFYLKKARADEPLLVPVGYYKVAEIKIARIAQDGAAWSLSSSNRGAVGVPHVSIRTNKEPILQAATPLTARANVRATSPQAYFDLALMGKDGLWYRIQAGESNPPNPPSLKLRTKSGSWEKEYKFQFG